MRERAGTCGKTRQDTARHGKIRQDTERYGKIRGAWSADGFYAALRVDASVRAGTPAHGVATIAGDRELGISRHAGRRVSLTPMPTSSHSSLLEGRRLKVAFVGTHGVGKTTLCFDLAAQLKRLDLGVDIVKEVARRCPLPINEGTTYDAQAWILHTQIAEEIAAAAINECVICDRSVLDNYAYLVARVGRRAEFDALVATWVRSYDALFNVPVLSAPRFDGTRATSTAFQAEIDGLIDELIAAFGVTVCDLAPGDRDGWTAQVVRVLGLPTQAPQIDLFVPTTSTGMDNVASASSPE